MSTTNYPLLIGVGGLLITTVLWSQLRKKNAVAVGEPPLLPGGLPVIGHAISLVRDANALHMYARCVVHQRVFRNHLIYSHTDSGQEIYNQYRFPLLANVPMYVPQLQITARSNLL